jgi:hypothetical protein
MKWKDNNILSNQTCQILPFHIQACTTAAFIQPNEDTMTTYRLGDAEQRCDLEGEGCRHVVHRRIVNPDNSRRIHPWYQISKHRPSDKQTSTP